MRWKQWRGKVILSTQTPEFQVIKGDDLKSKKIFAREMEWGPNIDFQKMFDLIKKVAIEGRLMVEEMIKKVAFAHGGAIRKASCRTTHERVQANWIVSIRHLDCTNTISLCSLSSWKSMKFSSFFFATKQKTEKK
ncbi:unnamed protein product [Eruca vesicaria subsp. sativa]|uniref:DUF7788 domain-containing protein n=1 Tax=Eruca vesicaria subsp. sativa TaxID=29727 RepID=A0ABC8JLS9_ERUVS|nr:unnamed protein product [Eruca vesicaria subsp. sativa]